MGALVHEVLYRCDLGDPDSASEWAPRLCRDRRAEALTLDVERHARSVLESPLILVAQHPRPIPNRIRRCRLGSGR